MSLGIIFRNYLIFIFIKINGAYLIDNLTFPMWNEKCDASNDYFSYLEDLLVIENSTFVSLDRYKCFLFSFLYFFAFILLLNQKIK
jgi:hypothetical protein